MPNRLPLITVFLLAAVSLHAAAVGDSLQVRGTKIYSDSAIYQGINLKLDLFTPVLEAARSRGDLQSYEMALNVRLKQRFYPTLELGYAFGKTTIGECTYDGQGGFAKVGLDINGLKKHPESPNALLVGVRIATAYQGYDLKNVYMNDTFWDTGRRDFTGLRRCDVWGEIVGGCQVLIVSGFTMGWYIRLKLLFTKTEAHNGPMPYYIPGFGFRDDTNWGISYYLGWKF